MSSRSRAYCLTLNNPTEDDEKALLSLPTSYCVYQYERGASGTPHIQAYCYFQNPLRFSSLKAVCPTAHIEVARGSPSQNRVYCTKSETRLDGPYEYGELPAQGKRSDLAAVVEAVDEGQSISEIASSFPTAFIKYHSGIGKLCSFKAKGREELGLSKPLVYVFWGVPGSGKSYKAQQIAKQYSSCYYLHKSGALYWWDGYTGQDVVIVNDFYGHYPYSELLNLLDAYNNKVNFKGGSCQFTSKVVIFTSNKPPQAWYKCIASDWSHQFQPIKCALERRIDKVEEFTDVYVVP